MDTTIRTRRLLTSNLGLLTWLNFWTELRFYAPVLILYFADVTGSFALGGSLFAVATISAAAFEVPTGLLSDRVGRRQTVILAALAHLLAVTLYAFGGSFTVLVLGSLARGLAAALQSGNNEALLYESLATEAKTDEYASALGKTTAPTELAAALAALVGSALAFWSFPLVLWLSVVPQVIAVWLSSQLIEPSVHTRSSGNIYGNLGEAFRAFRTNTRLRLLALAGSVSFAIGESNYQFRAAFIATLWPVWTIGITRTFSSVCSTISFWFSGRIMKRMTSLGALMVAILYSRVTILLGLVYPTVVSPLLLSVASFGHGLGVVAWGTLIQEELSDSLRATMASLISFLGSVLFGLAAITLGAFFDAIGPGQALFYAQLFTLIPILLYWRVHQLGKKNS